MDELKRVQYLGRIGIERAEDPDARFLAALQLAHLQNIFFENLSIHWGEPMGLEEKHLFEKIALKKRGGLCYECNTLFARLLESLGFRIRLVSARVVLADGRLSSEFDHMAILVELEEPWLADVGFGDTFTKPLRLRPGLIQLEEGRAYRLDKSGDSYLLQQNLQGQGWKTQYQFTIQARQVADFQEMFLFHQHSPQSHFKKAPLASLVIPGGRKTLSGNKLIHTSFLGDRTEKDIAPDDYLNVLYQEFGVSKQQ